MGLDFWAVKLKKGLKKDDYYSNNCWNLVENDEIDSFLDKETLNFLERWNDKNLYRFCKDTVGFFVGGDPVDEYSKQDINELANRLNDFIEKNPDYVYKCEEGIIYNNTDIRTFIKYINTVRDNGFVIWCSW